MWEIERLASAGEYTYAYVPNHPHANKCGYVYEHRIVMENFLGRLLLDTEVVHHINGNRKDNRSENLEVLLAGEHNRRHNLERHAGGKKKILLTCENCGIDFWRELRQLKKENKHYFCSKKCLWEYQRKDCPAKGEKRKISLTCSHCGKIFIREYSYPSQLKRYKNTFCSKKCNSLHSGFIKEKKGILR